MAWKPSNFWYRLLDFWSLWKKGPFIHENGALRQKWHKTNWSGGILIPIFVLDTRAWSFVLCPCVQSPLLCKCVGISREIFGKNVFLKEQQQTLSRWWTLCNQTHICSVLKKSGKKLSKSGETSLLLGVNKFLWQVRRLILCTYSNDNDSHA